MFDFLFVLLVYGYISNEYGRVGCLISDCGRVSKVYAHSPAHDQGLMVGDVVIEADGVKGFKYVDGIAGTWASITVRRGKTLKNLMIDRVPKDQVFD